MTKKTFDYNAKMQELETILAKLQASDTPLDEAMKLHEQGRVLIESIGEFLEQAQNTIETVLKKDDDEV